MKNLNLRSIARANSAQPTSNNQAIKAAKESVPYKEMMQLLGAYKEGSIFRVLDFFNSPKVMNFFKLKEKLTIDELKTLCPEQFGQKVDKKGRPVKKVFTPSPFFHALRNQIIKSLV